MTTIKLFATEPFIAALKAFFAELKVPIDFLADEPASPEVILGEKYTPGTSQPHQLIDDVYALGMVNDAIFAGKETFKNLEAVKKITTDYDGLLIFGVTLKNRQNDLLPTRSQLAEITRSFNQAFPYTPVTIIFKYGNYLSFANSERIKYKQAWREGEKVGKVTMLKDVYTAKPHAAHLKILAGLAIDTHKINSFAKLYNFWQSVFSLQALNDQFYSDLQAWFYFASQNIKLPFKPDYINEKENIKNFLVRLLARTMFCWFVKEKGLIKQDLLELTDWEGNKYNLTRDVDEKDFLQSNTYYRGVLQNIFYNALNQKEKKSLKDFKWTKYLHPDFSVDWLTEIPYLNGGIFDELKPEDNARESIEDSVICIPNYLFYGIETEEQITKGKGAKATTLVEKVEHQGLNGILKSYKFTLDENTPFEEDIALDPEMLGLVFENLLAELDPNLEESTIKSIRKLTGSYYTPRKTIYEMVNDSLFLYLFKFLQKEYSGIISARQLVSDLVYFNLGQPGNTAFCQAIVHGLDKFKMLDPACGSGAFPMGMLHRMVDILKLVDPKNELWIELKLKNVDFAQRAEFKKVLTSNLDDYGRKLGIIRDSIYGIDIQPMAVQITKLRFFISLLIDQKTDKGITPMPNIETKIICADSLKNIKVDLFSKDPIDKLTDARTRYYQPDISHIEREKIASEIVEILDVAFPSFAFQITGKRIAGQNKALLKEWFTHSTIAAPFFNMDFFFPELIAFGGFDCAIGNPPYGGIKISDEVREALDIESKDPYGAFIARFLNAHHQSTPLKHGGVLAFIVSDTFMTIKSHLKLRRLLMQNYVHKMLRMHPDTFRATVNTVIMIAERNTEKEINDKHVCLMADLTNISIHDDYERFIEVLSQTKGVGFESGDALQCISNPEYAIYYYPQTLIKTNSNLPFFVASPTLFALMNDKKFISDMDSKVKISYLININDKILKANKLGDEYSSAGNRKKWKEIGLLKIISGIKTGGNDNYVYKTKEGRGNYRIVDIENILDIEEICNLKSEEKLEGLNKDNFGGRYIVPLDKGGESDSGDGWMPNYFVPTAYYIDWSQDAVSEMAKQPHSDLANSEFRFKLGITYSRTGAYAPTFRLSAGGILESKGCGLFTDFIDNSILLGVLNSKIVKYLIKNFVMHSVESSVGTLPNTMIILPDKQNQLCIKQAVENIIEIQKSNPRYDYASHEQIEIDKLVYEAYGLNAEDVQEVEDWYARRYPKLSAAQKANLRALGRSNDYLELYGLK
jgi:hypothetical protein